MFPVANLLCQTLVARWPPEESSSDSRAMIYSCDGFIHVHRVGGKPTNYELCKSVPLLQPVDISYIIHLPVQMQRRAIWCSWKANCCNKLQVAAAHERAAGNVWTLTRQIPRRTKMYNACMVTYMYIWCDIFGKGPTWDENGFLGIGSMDPWIHGCIKE